MTTSLSAADTPVQAIRHGPQKSLQEMIAEANQDSDDDNNNNNNNTNTFNDTQIAGRPTSASVIDFEALKEEYAPYIESMLEWANSQENVDVYQMTAFYTGTHELSYYLTNYWKMFTCQFIQTFGLLILLYDEWVNNEKGLCYAQSGLTMKMLAFFLLSFLALRLSGQITAISGYGMYQWGPRQPPFLNTGWVAYGLFVNYITLIISFFISLLVVYVSGSALDMILNFVAILDDEMVTWQNFADIETWIEDEGYMHFLRDLASRRKRKATMEYDEEEDEDRTGTEMAMKRVNNCWNTCGVKTLSFLAGAKKHPKIIRNIFAPFVIMAPMVIAICY